VALYDQIGGDKLREVIADFYDRMLSDVMIGFLFVGKDRQRLIDKEWEFTARLLGADVEYTGKPIRQAHAKSPILGGHFERRLQILRETLADHQVAPGVQDEWLGHTLKLRKLVTADRGSECDHERVAQRMGRRLPLVDK
jgi:hemoglobin